ncbi:MAG: MFS transporter [Candidatus Ratteibacteria bacterium]|nr:MFS transporter [Candidatus Ratteibacteria bacterium]
MFLLILASAAFGLGIGLYDFLLPLFLDDLNISYGNMGVIFSFSALLLFFIRIYSGHIADTLGRKHIFGLSLFFCGITNLFTPFFPFIGAQILLKSLREASVAIKETVQQLLIFDRWKKSFRIVVAWVAGFDSTFQGVGAFVGGILLAAIGYKYTFVYIGLFVLLIYVLFLSKFRDASSHVENQNFLKRVNFADLKAFPWASPFRHRLSPQLALLNISGFLLGVGISMSHSFIAPLFFYHKFSLSPIVVSVIIAFHRLSLGLPMILTGRVVKWNLKWTAIISILIQGIFTSVAVIPKYFLVASVIWLMHDVIGATFWLPARNTLIQHHSRDKSRGLDVGMVLAWQALGWIFGPLIAGWSSNYSIDYPFLLSGVVTAAAAIPLIWLEGRIEEQTA